jgi:hypothetical protein
MAALVTRQRTWSYSRRIARIAHYAEPAGGACRTPIMPSLFRFLVVVSVIGGLTYALVFSLANFVSYKPREIIVTVPSDKFVKQQR